MASSSPLVAMVDNGLDAGQICWRVDEKGE
jgi:hypothetical protein